MRNEDIKELLQVQTQALKAEIKATNDMLGYKLDELTTHVKITNGRVTDLETKAIGFDDHCKNTKKITRHWKPILIASAVFIILISATTTLIMDKIDWVKTFEKQTGIELLHHEKENR